MPRLVDFLDWIKDCKVVRKDDKYWLRLMRQQMLNSMSQCYTTGQEVSRPICETVEMGVKYITLDNKECIGNSTSCPMKRCSKGRVIGGYHTHPTRSPPEPSIGDIDFMFDRNLKIECIGGVHAAYCYTPVKTPSSQGFKKVQHAMRHGKIDWPADFYKMLGQYMTIALHPERYVRLAGCIPWTDDPKKAARALKWGKKMYARAPENIDEMDKGVYERLLPAYTTNSNARKRKGDKQVSWEEYMDHFMSDLRQVGMGAIADEWKRGKYTISLAKAKRAVKKVEGDTPLTDV